MKTEDLELTVGDGTMAAFLAAPDAGATRAMIVIPEAFGLNDQIRNTARRVADAGITALALDVFHRSGAPVAPYTDFAQVKALFAGLDDDAVGADIDAAVAHLGDAGFSPDRTAIVGFCFGGRVSFLAAIEHALGAAISFYGGGIVEQGAFRAFRGCSTGLRRSARRGSASSATVTARSRPTTSSASAPPSRRRPCRPRSSATPTPTTGSTATSDRRTTRRRRPTLGAGRSSSSTGHLA